MAKVSKRKPRYKPVLFKLLLNGQPFKHSKKLKTWHKKSGPRSAASLNGQLVIVMHPLDKVWVDFGVNVVDLLG